MQGQFTRFVAVGSVGFVVDAGTLHFLVATLDFGPYLGRVISFLIAATVTWILNRHYTFRECSDTLGIKRQWILYIAVNAIGGIINYLTYASCIALFDIARQYLIIGVAAGSVAGLLVNFSANKYLVFRPRSY